MFDGVIEHIYGQPDDDCNQDYFIWPGGGLVGWFGFMVFNATFNNISVISWWSILLVEETREPEKTTDLSQVTDKLYHIMLYTSP